MSDVTEPGRIASLDIVRGVAVMGILAMNIVAFSMPFQAYMNPAAYGLEGPADLGAQRIELDVAHPDVRCGPGRLGALGGGAGGGGGERRRDHERAHGAIVSLTQSFFSPLATTHSS